MEEKKFDATSFIGMLLLGGIMLWWMNTNKPKVATEEETKTTKQIIDSVKPQKTLTENNFANDSLRQIAIKNKLGAFAVSGLIAKEATSTIENELVKLTISNKGGQITEALVKKFKTHDSLPIYLIKDNNAFFNISFGTTNNRTFNTQDLFFEPTLTKNGENSILSMKLKVSDAKFLEYRYEIKPNDYRVNFTIKTQGLDDVISSSTPINLIWNLKTFRNEKSMRTESMYSHIYYKTDGDVEYISMNDDEIANKVDWVAFKQHFFSSILMTDKEFNEATIISKDHTKDNENTPFLNTYTLKTPLTFTNGELNYAMKWFYGPSDYNLLKTYKGTDVDEIADLGWGIFGFLNEIVFYPVFNFLKGFIGNYGLIIIFLTIVVKILLSPVLYKSYSSSAKMKIIRPEMEEINKKFPGKENAMKRQQEVMNVQRKAGVSMMSGCIPALLQMPVLFALIKFFPTNFDFRQKGFLWANDLSSYDVIYSWKTHIPIVSKFFGNHISLLPILASAAIFFYMKMNQGQQANMQAPPQEGMPDMSKMMKYMIYISPVMMLLFFNNYASGLSLYYFVANLLTIAIMFVIKNYVIDEEKLHAKIQENKKKPMKKSKFRERLDAAMKQAQEQQEQQRRKSSNGKK